MEKLLRKWFGMKYYVWQSTTEKSWTLDYSGNDLAKFNNVLVKTYRAKSWSKAQNQFNKIRSKQKYS